MKKPAYVFYIMTLFCGLVFAQNAGGRVRNVAVIETQTVAQSVGMEDISRADLMEITNVLRREAVKNLPRNRFNVMTSETVQSMGDAVLADCAEENCVIALGSKIGADYIVRGMLSKIRGRYSLTVEMFETEYGNLVAVTPDPIRSGDLDELIDRSPTVCAAMYKSFMEEAPQASRQAAATAPPSPSPRTQPPPPPQASRQTAATAPPSPRTPPPPPAPPPPPQPPRYMLMVNVRPTMGGTVLRNPDLQSYQAGTNVAITARPSKGYEFAGWTDASGAVVSTDVTLEGEINSNLTLTANFDKAAPPPRPQKTKPELTNGTRYGVRSAYNVSHVPVYIYYTGAKSTVGHGFELGLATSTYLSRFWTFRSGADLIFRCPVNSDGDYSLREVGIAIPALIRVGGSSLRSAMFLETGLQLDFPLSDINRRNLLDVGYVAGVGFSIGRHIEVDNRFVFGMFDFVDVPAQRGNKLFQYSLGLTYMIGGK